MGLFNKLNALLDGQIQQDIQQVDPKTGLYKRGLALQQCPGTRLSQEDLTKTLPELFLLCMERLSRSGGRNPQTALSVLKAYIPFEYGVCIDVREEKNHIYTASGIDIKKGEKAVQNELKALIKGGCRLIPEADLPASLNFRPVGEIAVLPILDGKEAWIILASPKGKKHNHHIRDLFLDASAKTFLPPVVTPNNTSTSDTTLVNDGTRKKHSFPAGKKFAILHIENVPSLKDLLPTLSKRLPESFHLYSLDESSYLLLAPPKEDIELLWHHIASRVFAKKELKKAETELLGIKTKKEIKDLLEDLQQRGQ